MSYYDEIEIEDFDFDEDTRTYTYPCPCGDKFQITEEELFDGEEVATCPSCSLIIRVIYDPDDFERDEEDEGTTVTFSTPAAAPATVSA
ncbi:Diphthamide biosynthesis protein 3 [Blastocladiella emersonii ATCC 22665]|nr:Diphthamide biosynthesis protein 3 [Blastocladiella emersonii ATCC 22665]